MVVLFDLDGTLTDPYVGIARSFDHALARLGISPADDFDYKALIGPPIRNAFDLILGPDPEGNHERPVALYRERYADVGLFENTPYDGVAAMLATLAREASLFVCTSKPTVYAQRILERFKLAHYFRSIYGCELDGTRGNKADLLAWILARESLDARESILIGDRLHDMTAAVANSVAGAGVLWGYGSEAELHAAGAMHVFATPGDITSEALHALL